MTGIGAGKGLRKGLKRALRRHKDTYRLRGRKKLTELHRDRQTERD